MNPLPVTSRNVVVPPSHAETKRVTPFKLTTLGEDMSARFGGTGLSKHAVSMTLVAMFTLQPVPVVSAGGMQSCIGGRSCVRPQR